MRRKDNIAENAVRTFNEAVSDGGEVIYYPLDFRGPLPIVRTTTEGPAFINSLGAPAVFLKGVRGAVPLNSIEVI